MVFLGFRIIHIILELLIVEFLEDIEPSSSAYLQRFYLKEAWELTEGPSYEGCLIVLMENQIDYPELQSVLELSTHEEHVQYESTLSLQNAKEVELRRCCGIRRPAISRDYVVYLQESVFDVGPKDDLNMFSQAMNEDNFILWFNATKEYTKSMAKNQVYDLVDLPKEAVAIGCKWVHKTKMDTSGNVETYKARLVASQGFYSKGRH
jgi:hypothetical protein